MGEGGADPAAALGWRPFPPPDSSCDTRKVAENLDDNISPAGYMAKGGVASAHSGALASNCSPSMEGVRATTRHVEQPGVPSTVTDPLARRDDTCREEFFSCEGSEPEGRPNGGAGTDTVEQKPHLPENGRSILTMRYRPDKDAASTTWRCPTNRARESAGESPDSRELVVLNHDERNRETDSRHANEDSGICGSVEASLVPVLAPRETATLEVDPQDLGKEDIEGVKEGCSSTPCVGTMGASEVCLGAPLSLEQGGCQALLSPALSCAIGTNPEPLMETNLETQHQPPTEKKPADDSRQGGERRTEIPTCVGKKLHNAENNDAQV